MERRSPGMCWIWIKCFSVLMTWGTLMLSSKALVKIFASDFVRRVLIWVSSCGCRYDFGILSLWMVWLGLVLVGGTKKIFASAPWDISFFMIL